MIRLAWLDHSESDRRRALDLISLFRVKDTMDELGIGTIRDALSELLFPGTSTLHTRARYFLFIPWVYRRYEEKRVPSSQIAERARGREIRLASQLMEVGETEGVIGISAGASLKRLPSELYWSGLRRWGIRRFSGSRADYHRFLDLWYRAQDGASGLIFDEAGEPLSGGPQPNWDPCMPPAPHEFPRDTGLALRREEAEYLRDRILATCGSSYLCWLVTSAELFEPTAFPWEVALDGLPPRLETLLLHARNFAESMQGAGLLYNLLVHELLANEESVVDFRERLEEWFDLLLSRHEELRTWDLDHLWEAVRAENDRIPDRTHRFVMAWLDLLWAAMEAGDLGSLVEGRPARDLIRHREHALKGKRARLWYSGARERWGGESGASRLDYRWNPVVQNLVTDILRGLHGGEG